MPPTGKRVQADYVYVMDFDGDRIRHMTKIWNDGISLKQLTIGNIRRLSRVTERPFSPHAPIPQRR